MAGDSSARCLMMSFSLCFASFYFATGIASLVVAYQDGDNPCQHADKTGITLRQWNYVKGSIDLFCGAMIVFIAWVGTKKNDDGCMAGCVVMSTIVFLLVGFFSLAWFVIGIVILARSNGACVVDSTDIGNMTLAALILTTIGLMMQCGARKSSSSD